MENKFYLWQKLVSKFWLGKKRGNQESPKTNFDGITPQETKMKRFAFLIHPRTTAGVARRFRITKFLPSSLIEAVLPRLRGRLGFTVCSKFKVVKLNKTAEGYIAAVILSGKQMMTLPLRLVHRRILEAVLFAQNKLGAEVIGLGALTTSLTEGGKWLLNQPEVKLTITHGDTYGVVVAEEGIEKILSFSNFNPKEVKIAIVGAYGLIGREITKILAKKEYPLVLIEKNEEKVRLIKDELKKLNLENNILTASTNLKDIYDADLIITATSHPGALLKSEHLKKGAIIYDIAQPMNASPKLIKERPDIIKIDGAYVDINGIDLGFNMGPPPGTTYACLVETIMMALEGENNHHVGEIDPSFIEKTKQWAKEYGFAHAPFTCFGKPISVEKFLEYRK